MGWGAMVVDRRVSRISSSVVTLSLGRVEALSRRSGSGQMVVRALEIWVGADLRRGQPVSRRTRPHQPPK